MIKIKYKLWTIVIIFVFSILYSFPNFYGENPVIVIKKNDNIDNEKILIDIENQLKIKNIKNKFILSKKNELIIKFFSTEDQLNIFESLKDNYGIYADISLNIMSDSKYKFFEKISAYPMKFGLDLRGGVSLLIQINLKDNINDFLKSRFFFLKEKIKSNDIIFDNLKITKENLVEINFFSKSDLKKFIEKINLFNDDFNIVSEKNLLLILCLNNKKLNEITLQIINKTKHVLLKRINELGIVDSVVQTKGKRNIIIEIPGIQDIARAKNILGKTATLEFMLVDNEHNVDQVIKGKTIKNSKIFYTDKKIPILLKNKSILSGESIIYASSGFDQIRNKPCVNIKLGKKNIKSFEEITKKNIGKQMAIIYKESFLNENKIVEFKEVIISIATIMSTLSRDFQITGLNLQESRDLSLLLRSGSLPASISVIEEKIIGPNLGERNITNGIISVFMSFVFMLLFMLFRYKNFGLIACFGLVSNLLLLISIMSIVGTTLTLPGLAGIALTLAMSIDANVLIFERIKEEENKEKNIYSAIKKGFKNALTSIIDSNLTTLLIGIILFIFSYGPVRGFAVTLSIGILTSIYSSVFVTQTMINYFIINKYKYKKQ